MLNYAWGDVVQELGFITGTLGMATVGASGCMGGAGAHPPAQSWWDNDSPVTVRDSLMGMGRSEPSKYLPESWVCL